MFNIIESGRLGHAEDPGTGSRYLVTFTKHDEDWPGTSSPTTFAVAREQNGQVNAAYGFFTEEECFDFLSGVGPMEYHSYSRAGSKTSEVRERLGIPDGMIKKYAADVSASSSRASTGDEPTFTRAEWERQRATSVPGETREGDFSRDSGSVNRPQNANDPTPATAHMGQTKTEDFFSFGSGNQDTTDALKSRADDASGAEVKTDSGSPKEAEDKAEQEGQKP